MNPSETNQPRVDDFDNRHRALQDLISAQGDGGELPALVEEAKEPSWLESWLDGAWDAFTDWLESAFGSDSGLKKLESIDWEATLLMLFIGLLLVGLFAFVRFLIKFQRGKTKFIAHDAGMATTPLRQSDLEYLSQLLASQQYAEAMLTRWRICQHRIGLHRHVTPLEFCYGRNIRDRAPVNQAYQYMFGHKRAAKAHYQAFDRWLSQHEGGPA